MPTGVALRDVREQLFAAAERILTSAGPNALTSRAVTAEAGVAKGVLHRHFPDFDAFLTDLVGDRITAVTRQATALRDAAGTGTVAGHLAEALVELFSPVTVAIVALITSRDELRSRLRRAHRSAGIPLLAEATTMVEDYLSAERHRGRLPAAADPAMLALLLIGSGHLVFAGRPPGTQPSPEEIHRMVTSILP